MQTDTISPENTVPQTLFLLDGSSYIYRAYYGIPERTTSDGRPTHAVFGFTRMLLNLLQAHRPEALAVVFDRPREETFRRQLYAEYKANRSEMPEDLAPQIALIKQIVQAMNIAVLDAPGFEADDVIATLARQAAFEGKKVTVVTSDKDLMQIVTPSIDLLDTMKDLRSGPAEVEQRFGVGPDKVADILGLAGDTSDNIPGVPGIGEKTAAELVRKFGTLEEVLEWRGLVKGKKRQENLRLYADQARLSKTLATVRYDVPLEASPDSLTSREPNLELLIPLLRDLEFQSLEIAFTPPPPGVVELYSDGSGTSSGPGGYGVVLRFGKHEKEVSGFEPEATSQRMELLAAIRGLESLKGSCRVQVYSDSQYLVRGMNEWLAGWIRKGRLDDDGELANTDLWRQLVPLAEKHQIGWNWVKGHAGHPFNERCDRLAKQAVEKGTAPLVDQLKPEPPPAVPPGADPIVEPATAIQEFPEGELDDEGQRNLC